MEVSYHSAGNGGIERVNRTIVHMLGMLVEDCRDDWEVHLTYVEFAHKP